MRGVLQKLSSHAKHVHAHMYYMHMRMCLILWLINESKP